VNVPVGVNVNETGDDSATSTASVGATPANGDAVDSLIPLGSETEAEAETEQNEAALALQANKSDDPTNKIEGENEAKQEAEAKVKSEQGDQANVALAGEKSKQDQDVEAENGDIEQKAKAKAENDSDQDNKSFQANKAVAEAVLAQVSKADASVNTSQVNLTIIKTGDNTINGYAYQNAVGITQTSQMTGNQQLNQQSVNIQANIYK
jgi:membrane protein involved in colicin uptake